MTDYIVDSHCHLNYKGLGDDLDAVITRAMDANVGAMLAINCRLSEFDEVRDIASGHDRIWCSVGVHPHEAADHAELTLDDLLSRAEDPNVIGIGETGLDYYYEHSPRDVQQRLFRLHIEAARQTGLPLIVHSRDAEDDTMRILGEEAEKGAFPGLIHCFTAGQALADHALGLGLTISISGIVTFNSAKDLQAVAKDLPADRILVETDAPYLAPVPHRGKRCEPAYVADTLNFLAALRGTSVEDLRQTTTDNFFRLFSKATPPQAINRAIIE